MKRFTTVIAVAACAALAACSTTGGTDPKAGSVEGASAATTGERR